MLTPDRERRARDSVTRPSHRLTRASSPLAEASEGPPIESKGDNPVALSARRLIDSKGENAGVLSARRLIDSEGENAGVLSARRLIDSKGENAGVLSARRLIDSKGENAGVLSARRPLLVGRYKLCEEIAVGGMAAVHFGRILGDENFTRPVAIKRLHPHLARDPAFVSMFLTEAHLAARISHPNVVAMLDVVRSREGEVLLVMEYVAGASLAHLLRAAPERGEEVPVGHVVAVVLDALAGLHSAHQTLDDHGRPLGLVHRDVSPQNILVGIDGRARVLDFGIAKATEQPSSARTSTGVIKGKLGYMAPEQFNGRLTRASDIYSAAVVLWEGLASRRLFQAETEAALIHRILVGAIEPPSAHRAEISPALDAVVLRALSVDPGARFATAEEMAVALRAASAPSPVVQVGEWVRRVGGEIVRQHTGRPSRGAQMSLLSLPTSVPPNTFAPPLVSSGRSLAGDAEIAPRSAPAPARRRIARHALLVLGPAAVVAAIAVARSGRSPSAVLAAPATSPSFAGAPPALVVSTPLEVPARGNPPPRADASVAIEIAPRPSRAAAGSPSASSGRHGPAASRSSGLRPPDAKIINALDSRE